MARLEHISGNENSAALRSNVMFTRPEFLLGNGTPTAFQNIETRRAIDETWVRGDAPEMIHEPTHVQGGENGTLPRHRGINGLKHHKTGPHQLFIGGDAAFDATDSGAQFARRIDEHLFDAQGSHVRIDYLEQCSHVKDSRWQTLKGLAHKNLQPLILLTENRRVREPHSVEPFLALPIPLIVNAGSGRR
jgi:hypothetical protein